MTRFFNLLVPIFFFFSIVTYGQKRAIIKDIDFTIKNNLMVVDYNIVTKSNDSQSVLLYFWDRDFNVVIPSAVEGDVGKGVVPSDSKTITWDMTKDNQLLTSRLRPQVILKDEFYHRKGFNSVYLSMVVPGLGDYFVADHRNMVFKPYLRTITAVGFVSLGIVATNKIYQEPIYTDRIVNVRGPGGIIIPEIRSTFNGYGPRVHWLFSYDNFVFLSVGAAIWVYDIIWVATRGGRNDKLKRALSNVDFNFNSIGGGNLSYRLDF